MTRPAPIFKCPTSLFPMRPSGSPTDKPDASNVKYWSSFLENASITGVSA